MVMFRGDESSYLHMLHRVSGVVSSELSIDEVLGEIIGAAVEATDCDACLVYVLDGATNELVLRGAQGPHAADLGKLRMKMGEGVAGWVAEPTAAGGLSPPSPPPSPLKNLPH